MHCRTARLSKPSCICLAGRHICCTPSGHLQSLSIAIRGSCRVPASRSGGIVTAAPAVRRRPPKRRVMLLAPLFAVPILLLGINLASACWRGYAYGYGGYGYATIDPFIHGLPPDLCLCRLRLAWPAQVAAVNRP